MHCFFPAYLTATVINVARDVVDVLTQLPAFLGRQLALRGGRTAHALGTAVFHGGRTAPALFVLTAMRRARVAAFVRSCRVKETAAKPAEHTAIATDRA